MKAYKLIYITGVSGSGKTTIARLLSQKTGIPYFDADDFHPEANKQKMGQGIPLNDQDRKGWLIAIHHFAKTKLNDSSLIFACSALKEKYRKVLSNGLEKNCHWVLLNGSYELIYGRITARKDHYMPPELLNSQFEALEIPAYAMYFDIQKSKEEIVNEIISHIRL